MTRCPPNRSYACHAPILLPLLGACAHSQDRITAGPQACTTPAEAAVAVLYHHVAHLLPASWQGAEYWVQVSCVGFGCMPPVSQYRQKTAP